MPETKDRDHLDGQASIGRAPSPLTALGGVPRSSKISSLDSPDEAFSGTDLEGRAQTEGRAHGMARMSEDWPGGSR